MSKQEILQRVRDGVGYTTEVECPDPVGTMVIRSLSQIEVDEVNAMTSRDVRVKMRLPDPAAAAKAQAKKKAEGPSEPEDEASLAAESIELDMGLLQQNQQRADRTLVAHALTTGGDHWKPADAGQLPPAAFRKLAKAAKEHTGLEFFEDAEKLKKAAADAAAVEPEASEVADEAATFREEPGGADDARDAVGGRAAVGGTVAG